jgi:RNA polymerase sigma factor (sigma-70 family)
MADVTAVASPTTQAVTAAWRRESGRLVAALTRMTGDLALAEDLTQDALVAALEQWPLRGVPDNPGAWLMAVAKRRAVDQVRRAVTQRRATAALGRDLQEVEMPDLEAQVDHIEDDVLRLMFLCCHPALTPDSRVALTLRLVAGLSTAEIARGFLAAEPAVAQRISRAKRTLARSRATLELPSGTERRERLDDVMAAVYLVFTEGYAAAGGSDWTRPDLCHEAVRLSRVLVGLVPDDPEVLSLQALLELQASRLPARTDRDGRAVLLDEQDRRRWDVLLVRRGRAALAAADELAAAGRPVGRYYLQAAIAAHHARGRTPADTDWPAIARLYDVLGTVAPGPVVEVNRAVAHGRAYGPAAGLAVLAALPGGALAGSPLVPAVRGDLLLRDGRRQAAAEEFRAAAAASRNHGERDLLRRRSEEAAQPPPG